MNQTVTLTPVSGGSGVEVELGDGYAAPTATGGWQAVARPRRTSMTEWQGRDPIGMDVPVLLDGGEKRKSVEGTVGKLFGFMLDVKGAAKEPIVLKITGVPVPFKDLQWVLNGIEPGDEMRREEDGLRHRAAMTLNLLEYVPGDVLVKKDKPKPAKEAAKETPAAKAADKKPAAKAKTVTVKSGDTLWILAAKYYGDGNKWQRIADANGIRDPRALRIGQSLKIPS